MASRPIVREFIWQQDPDHGNWGWQMKGMPHFNAAAEASTVYHDCMEHLTKGTELSDEFQAFGSMLYLRVVAGFEPNERAIDRYTVEEGIGSDLASFIRDELRKANLYEVAPLRSKHAFKRIHGEDGWINQRLDMVIQNYLKDFTSEWHGTYEEPDSFPSPSDMAALTVRIRHWIIVGYLACRRRWDDAPAYAQGCAYRVTEDVKELTKQLTRNFGDGMESYGARLKVKYWPKTGEHRVNVYHYGHDIRVM